MKSADCCRSVVKSVECSDFPGSKEVVLEGQEKQHLWDVLTASPSATVTASSATAVTAAAVSFPAITSEEAPRITSREAPRTTSGIMPSSTTGTRWEHVRRRKIDIQNPMHDIADVVEDREDERQQKIAGPIIQKSVGTAILVINNRADYQSRGTSQKGNERH